MVILQDTHALSAWQPSNLTRIINIEVSARGNSRATIFMFKPLHNVATDLPWTRLAAQQLAHQMRIRWPLMDSFTMSRVHDLDGLGIEVVSQLVKTTWTKLVHLHLPECDVKAQGFLMLSQGVWPGLKFLDVSRNCLDAEGIALLAKGNRPSLTNINLSFDPTMNAVAIAHLSAANWPTEELVIEDASFSIDMAAELADLQLPNLMALDLMKSHLTIAAVSELARADWPSLRMLSFGHNDPDAVAILLGLKLDLKKMQKLKSDACLIAVGLRPRLVSQPGLDLWPNLNGFRFTKYKIHLYHASVNAPDTPHILHC